MNASLPESPSGAGWVISEDELEDPETKDAWSPEGIRAGAMGVSVARPASIKKLSRAVFQNQNPNTPTAQGGRHQPSGRTGRLDIQGLSLGKACLAVQVAMAVRSLMGTAVDCGH